jgi:hypothetical protein
VTIESLLELERINGRRPVLETTTQNRAQRLDRRH